MSEENNKRPRSPNFPYATLRESISLIETLYKKDKQNFVPIKISLNHMGLSVNSSTSRRFVSSMIEYGLLKDRGEGDEKELIISDLGRNIILDERQNSQDRLGNIRKAALNSKIMHEAWDKWKGEIPSEDTIKYVLISSWGFTDRAAARFTKVVQDNFEFASLEDYYDSESDPEKKELNQQPLNNLPSQQKQQYKSGGQNQQVRVKVDWLDFNLSLGADQQARLLISNTLSEDDFDFLLVWIKRLKNDIVENNQVIEVNNNEDDIPF